MKGQRSEISATDSDVLRWVSSCSQALAPLYLLVDALLLKPALCMYTKWLIKNRWDPCRTHPSCRIPSFSSSRRCHFRLTCLEITHRRREDSSSVDKLNLCSQSVGIFHCRLTSLKSFYMYKAISICKYICIYWSGWAQFCCNLSLICFNVCLFLRLCE